jgi:hypothetical protein
MNQQMLRRVLQTQKDKEAKAAEEHRQRVLGTLGPRTMRSAPTENGSLGTPRHAVKSTSGGKR